MSARILIAVCLLLGCTSHTQYSLPLGNDSTSCGGCHETHFDEWQTSAHGTSHASPVFRAMLPVVDASWGALARSTCEGCHQPNHSDEPSIGCVSCHAAVGNHGERDGMLAIDLDAPIAGPLADPEVSPAHRTREGEFLQDPSLCGTCHEITGPRLVNEPTLTEYRASPAAEAGQTCMDCHMPTPESPRALSNVSNRLRSARSHRFVGFDPPVGASAEESLAAAERTRTLLAEALALRVETTANGVAITVENVGAAHNVPTGAAFLRDLYVDLETADGELVAERVLRIGDQPMRGDTAVALLTDADHVAAGSLAPGETVYVEVPFTFTEGRAVLRGRAVRDEVLTALDLDAQRDAIPTHEIHTVVFNLR